MRYILLGLVLIIYGCSDNTSDGVKHVAILKLGSHELIDQVESSTIKGLKEKYGDQIEISQFNGNFQPETIRQSVAQIVHSDVDVAIPITTSATNELVNSADENLDVVFSFVSNPEEVWGKGKPRPSFVTGTSDQLDYEKNVALIRRLFPEAKAIGYLVNQSEPNARDGLEKMKNIAPKYGFKLNVVGVSVPGDVVNAARSIVTSVDVFLVGGDNTVVGGIGGLLSVADDKSIPVFAVENTSVKEGALAAYGVNYSELGAATADMVIAVLEGKRPQDIPVNYFSKTKLFVNQKTSERFKISSTLLLDAEKL